MIKALRMFPLMALVAIVAGWVTRVWVESTAPTPRGRPASPRPRRRTTPAGTVAERPATAAPITTPPDAARASKAAAAAAWGQPKAKLRTTSPEPAGTVCKAPPSQPKQSAAVPPDAGKSPTEAMSGDWVPVAVGPNVAPLPIAQPSASGPLSELQPTQGGTAHEEPPAGAWTPDDLPPGKAPETGKSDSRETESQSGDQDVEQELAAAAAEDTPSSANGSPAGADDSREEPAAPDPELKFRRTWKPTSFRDEWDPEVRAEPAPGKQSGEGGKRTAGTAPKAKWPTARTESTGSISTDPTTFFDRPARTGSKQEGAPPGPPVGSEAEGRAGDEDLTAEPPGAGRRQSVPRPSRDAARRRALWERFGPLTDQETADMKSVGSGDASTPESAAQSGGGGPRDPEADAAAEAKAAAQGDETLTEDDGAEPSDLPEGRSGEAREPTTPEPKQEPAQERFAPADEEVQLEWPKDVKESPEGERAARVYIDDGNTLYEVDAFEAAEHRYSRAIAAAPELVDAYYNRANARVRLGDLDGALADFDRALELLPNDPDALNNRGMLRLSAADAEHALRDFEQAAGLRPDDPMILVNLAVALTETKRFADALIKFERAATLDPKDAAAHYGAARAATQLGDLDGAFAHTQKALALEPSFRAEMADDPLLRALGSKEGFTELIEG